MTYPSYLRKQLLILNNVVYPYLIGWNYIQFSVYRKFYCLYIIRVRYCFSTTWVRQECQEKNAYNCWTDSSARKYTRCSWTDRRRAPTVTQFTVTLPSGQLLTRADRERPVWMPSWSLLPATRRTAIDFVISLVPRRAVGDEMFFDCVAAVVHEVVMTDWRTEKPARSLRESDGTDPVDSARHPIHQSLSATTLARTRLCIAPAPAGTSTGPTR